MTAAVRPVPVMCFDRTPDERLRGYDWTAEPNRLEDLLRSRRGELAVIDLLHQRTQDDLLLQYRLRVLETAAPEHGTPDFEWNNPVSVVFRDASGVLKLLYALPFVRLGNAYAAHSHTHQVTDQWLWWNVRLVGTQISSTYRQSADTAAPTGQALISDAGVGPLWRAYPRIEALLVTNWLAKYAIAEVRLWEGRNPAQEPAFGPAALMDRRLDGREPGLIGYWKFDKADNSNFVHDSSRFGRHGQVFGGRTMGPNESLLTLDCSLEDVAPLREAAADLNRRADSLRAEITGLEQKKSRLEAHIQQLDTQKQGIAADLQPKLDAIDRQIAEENTRHQKFLQDIAYMGAVSLDYFSEEVAREMNEAVERLKESAYQLERVALEVKVLPVHSEQDAGVKDYRVMFPDADIQVDAQQLSTLRFGFGVKPVEPEPGPINVPDVRGYTELAAQRKLREAGLRMVVMERATEEPDKIGRVIAQIVEEEVDSQRIVRQVASSDLTVNPSSVVTVFLGRPSYGGARGMSAGRDEPGT